MPSKVTARSSLRPAKKTFIVGLDGSELSLNAIHIAAAQMDDMRDNLLMVTFGKEEKDELHFKQMIKPKAESSAIAHHLLPKSHAVEFIHLEADWKCARRSHARCSELRPSVACRPHRINKLTMESMPSQV